MNEISAKTKLAGILGNPVSHSLSPKLHGYLAQKTAIDMVYLAFCPADDKLKAVLDGALGMGVLGFNITSPFKVKVVDLVDDIEPEALKMDNINTLVNRNGKWVGSNTDGDGFIQSLARRGVKPEDKHILLLGSGGTARTLSYKFAQNGAASITLASRKKDALKEIEPVVSAFVKTALFETVDASKRYDVVVNCTPLGMEPFEHENPMPANVTYHPALLCVDLIYNPKKTLFLREAESRGAGILNGMDMFIYQGIFAFERFTGQAVDSTIREGLFNLFSG